MSNNRSATTQQPIKINKEKGLQPAKNPPKMPEVKPPKTK
jgi:hypothetical protein